MNRKLIILRFFILLNKIIKQIYELIFSNQKTEIFMKIHFARIGIILKFLLCKARKVVIKIIHIVY